MSVFDFSRLLSSTLEVRQQPLPATADQLVRTTFWMSSELKNDILNRLGSESYLKSSLVLTILVGLFENMSMSLILICDVV
jgi:hypothetical protein